MEKIFACEQGHHLVFKCMTAFTDSGLRERWEWNENDWNDQKDTYL